jgi:hypothetical protein
MAISSGLNIQMPFMKAGVSLTRITSAHLSVGVVGVNFWARAVDCSLIFRGEADIGLNSPSVQIEANMTQDRLRTNREIGRKN